MRALKLIQPQQNAKNHENAIEGFVILANVHRTRILAIILFLVNFIFIFSDYIDKSNGLWISDGYKPLFYCHVVLGLITFLYILIFYKIKIHSANDITLAHKLYVMFFAYFILILTAYISGWIDQKINGQIIVYVIGCLATAVMYYFKPRVTTPLYLISWIFFLICLTFSQKNSVIREANYENAFLLIVISYFLATILYRFKHQDLMNKYNLEDLVAERTKELQRANDLLKQEILERQKAEVEIARLDRLNLIAEMAASISNEVRNPMTTVKGFLQLLKNKQESRDQEYFDLMIEELDRANGIISEFLSISRTKPTIFERLNLNDIVTSTLPLIQAEAQNNDKYFTAELKDVPDCLLNGQEIRQLLLNLVRNGFEAMSSGGQLTIKTYAASSEIVLVVSDDGKGIDQCVLNKLGTPFLTTKEQGTGLGLAVCYGIVTRHNGRISVETSCQGSAFHVYFPLLR